MSRSPRRPRALPAATTPPVQVCPLCGVSWSTPSPRCFCGYDFETGNPQAAIVRLSASRRRASRTWGLGLFALATLPVTCGAGIAYMEWFLPSLLFGLFQLGIGWGLTWRGLLDAYRSRKALAAAKALRQLPTARVVR
jgi:hypothetical protein